MKQFVLNTRAKTEDCPLTAALEAMGIDVLELPMLELLPVSASVLIKSLESLQEGSVVLFTSSNGIEFLQKAVGQERFEGVLQTCSLAVIGKKTAQALEKYNLCADFVSSVPTGEGFANELIEWLPKNKRIVFYKADAASDVLEEKLYHEGYSVDGVVSYRSALPEFSMPSLAVLRDFLVAESAKVLTFTSPKAAKNFTRVVDLLGLSDEQVRGVYSIPLVVMGPTTLKASKKLGFSFVDSPTESNFNSLASAASALF